MRNEIYRCETLLPGCSLTNCGYDAGNGTSTNLYNAADRITTVNTPAPGGGYLSQATTTSYDHMGRAWKVTLGGGEPKSTGACCPIAGCGFLLRMKRPNSIHRAPAKGNRVVNSQN